MKLSHIVRIPCLLLSLSFLFPPASWASMPEPGGTVWTSTDLNDVSPAPVPGTFSVTGTGSAAVYTLTGAGYFSGSNDSGEFYCQPLTGDGSLVAQVTSISGTAVSAGGAVMIRRANSSSAVMFCTTVTKYNGITNTYRSTAATSSTSVASGKGGVGYWIMVTRAGNTFTSSYSSTGLAGSWTVIGTPQIMANMTDTCYIGLASNSNNTTASTATFANVILSSSNLLGMTSSASLTGGTWQGCGLQAEYFNGSNLEASTNPFPGQRMITRIDPTVNTSWTGKPAPAMSGTFSVRWSGQITPRYSGTYTFNTTNSGGAVRIWVYQLPMYSGETTTPILDNWPNDTGVTSQPIQLNTGTPYHIQIEYTTTATPPANTNISVTWSGPGQASEVIPQQQLLPAYGGKGRVLAERWLNQPQSTYAQFVAQVLPPTYPQNPTGRRFLNTLSVGSNVAATGTNYAEKISGYFYPPINGTYIFYLTGHNDCQFGVRQMASTTLTNICTGTSNSSSDAQWSSDNTTQGSIYLFAGQPYYFEIDHKQALGAKDDCAVGWGIPGGAGTEKPIPGVRYFPNEPVASAPGAGHFIDYLASGHPRLFTDMRGFADLAALVTTASTQQNTWFYGVGGTPTTPTNPSLLYRANWLFSYAPTPASTSGDYLDQARQVLTNVTTLAMAYRITGNYHFWHRALEELFPPCGVSVTYDPSYGDTWTDPVSGTHTVAAWPNWGTSYNDLTNGEITNALAIGYDWLYEDVNGNVLLDSYDLSLLSNCILTGLNNVNGVNGYGCTPPYSSISYYASNHAAVDAGGAITGALAIVNDSELSSTSNAVCATALSNVAAALQYSSPSGGAGPLAFLAPDGINPESPDYDMYLMSYLGYGFGALETAAGGDMGLTQMPGQSKVGAYSLGIMGSVSMFNYNDAWYFGNISFSPAEFWYGWKFDQSQDAWSETQTANNLDGAQGTDQWGKTTYGSVSPFDLLWYDSRATNSANSSDPGYAGNALDIQYHNIDVSVFRTAYPSQSASNALFAAIKGGDNTSGHPHLQQGEFIIQANGVEWASVLGGDYVAYATGAYWHTDPNDPSGNDRWQYYKTRAEGSNTLVIGPNPGDQGEPDQNCGVTDSGSATAILPQSRVIDYYSSPSVANTILNMTALYPNATQVLRGLQMNRPATGPSFVIVQDEIKASSTTSINWYMHYDTNSGHTNVSTTVAGNTATETCNGQTTTLKILSPSTAVFTALQAAPSNPALNPPGQDTTISTNWHKLGILVSATGQPTTTICVEIVPGSTVPSYTVQELRNWPSP